MGIPTVFDTSPTYTGTVTAGDLEIDSGTLSIDATNNRVGIGTLAPVRSLHISGSGSQRILVESTDGQAGIELKSDSTNGVIIYSPNASDDLEFYLGGEDRVVFSEVGDVHADGSLFVKAKADALADIASYGQIWVNTATPNELYFTDDAGTDFQLGAGATALSGTTNNTICTVTGANAIQGEANLLFDGNALTVTGGQIVKRVILDTSSTTSYNVLATDYYIGVGSAGGTAQALTINLQAVSGLEGRVIIIKDESGECGTYNITIDGDGSETIDGQTTQVMNSNFASVTLVCNGASWSIV